VTRFDDRAFDALRRDADEVGRVRQRAAELLKTHRVGAFDGLGDVLRRVLPDDTEALTRVARILRFTKDQLDRLRWGDLDPAVLPCEPLAMLGQLLGLELESFLSLVTRDHRRFAEPGLQSGARAVTRTDASNRDHWQGLRHAWDRAASDIPDEG